MLQFNPITIHDKGIITSFTYPSNYLNCDFAFANMCSWRFLYDSVYTVQDGFLLIRFIVEEKGRKHVAYMFPVGNGDLKAAIYALEEDAASLGHPLLFLGVTPEGRFKLETLFPQAFSFSAERDYFDYVYLREELVSLKGKRFQPKRNHVNKFKKQYNHTYLPITASIVPQCMELEKLWLKNNIGEGDREELQHERRSMTFALQHFDELGLLGGAVVVDSEIVAFTYGSPINHQTFGVHVEKADVRYEGVFSAINQEFVSRIPQKYLYVNREEDLGLPGLRQSKLSYHPAILLEKCSALKRR